MLIWISAVSGMMLALVPARMLPTVSTAVSAGSISRATIVCSRITTAAASTTGSTVVCGIDACPPRPYSVTLMLSADANAGPAVAARCPAGSGVTC